MQGQDARLMGTIGQDRIVRVRVSRRGAVLSLSEFDGVLWRISSRLVCGEVRS
jgi:glucose/arabinose dehydrogenase